MRKSKSMDMSTNKISKSLSLEKFKLSEMSKYPFIVTIAMRGTGKRCV